MRLLIIEDDRAAADYLVKAFREVGHIADQAKDGEEGLALALDGQYDVLIVDRMLPKVDGLSIIASLRGKAIETPVLILSALAQVDDRVKGLGSGGAARAVRRRFIALLTLSSIGFPMKSAAPDRSCSCSRANFVCSNISCGMPVRLLPEPCCWRTCGTTTSIRKPTSSTFTFRVCGPRLTKASASPCCTPCAVPAI